MQSPQRFRRLLVTSSPACASPSSETQISAAASLAWSAAPALPASKGPSASPASAAETADAVTNSESALVSERRAAHSRDGKVMAMYDSSLDNIWPVEIKFVEDDTHTHASARAQLPGGETIGATGDAYRNPTDARQPMIGEEIAAARALISLGSALLQAASMRIEQVTHRPVHLSG
jgi:Domain of unknown function (DUF1876)